MGELDQLQTAFAGSNLAESEVAALEHAIAVAPSHVPSRLKLLGFYFMHGMRAAARERRAAHALWFIEHHPESEIVGSPLCQIDEDDPSYARACNAWKDVLAKKVPPLVLLRAAAFFTSSDPDHCRLLLERGEREAPTWPQWAAELGANAFRVIEVARRFAASGMGPDLAEDERKAHAREALAHYQRALALASTDESRFDLSENCAAAALACDLFADAERYADATLELARSCTSNRHHPDIVHRAHVTRGHVALEAGDIAVAKRELEQAGAEGSAHAPVLRSYGPDLTLATRLLALGEVDAVRAYLERCATFWEPARVARWLSAIERGERPRMHTAYEPGA